jgi:hypothetical protein
MLIYSKKYLKKQSINSNNLIGRQGFFPFKLKVETYFKALYNCIFSILIL